MKKTENTKLITVGELLNELKKFEKKHWDWNVEISTDESIGEDEDMPCIIIGMGLDEDGDLRIEIEEEWADGGDYYVAELIEHLRDFDPATRVYLAGGGLLFSIDNRGGIFSPTEDDDTLICNATAFGEYELKQTGWLTEAEKRELSKDVRKKRRESRIYAVVLRIIAFATLVWLICNVYALVTHTGKYIWENIMWTVVCVVLLVIELMTLYYSTKELWSE